MNVEIEMQDGIYESISILLGKADSIDKASGYLAYYLQQKMGEGLITGYDYTITDMGIADGFHATVEFSFTWNIGNTCHMLVIPKTSLAKAYDHAMGVI